MNSSRSGKKGRKIRWLRLSLFTLLVVLICGGFYFYNVYSNVASAVTKMNKPISREVSEKREEKVEFHRKDPISILMVGIDEREEDSGRTDSMLVITVNPEKKTTKILSIPRDTRTQLINNNNPKKNRTDKINHAYAYGGIEMSIDSVEHFLNIPIDYYVEVNMEGFKDIVDAVGGINVDNQIEFELDGVTLKEGPQHLNGTKALAYARMRKQDPRGDLGRGERQREVISKIIDKGKSLSTLTKYDDILGALENNIKTNLTLNEMVGIQSSYKPAVETVDKLEIEGEGQMINRIWYFIVDDDTRQSLSDELRSQLDLPQESLASIKSND
ncbi:membrane-bound protein transcriptional regulator LytR [Neobacillus bataviensis LMG 21833]|uniref:Membrane-bound protein transcriptional regulator LytR n=1 Tax=Neobacillus bataviensis LMG 21833 TaxID=1117379 RepID=K6DSK9_9BACI|nr:LCP family protein [Neobacillus bataviensis]EKN71344.1 membrane-bound protein transcriptional regulator LytR [Neobacillus bataviensis LMG 21833]